MGEWLGGEESGTSEGAPEREAKIRDRSGLVILRKVVELPDDETPASSRLDEQPESA